MRLAVDVNVVLDLLLAREGFAGDARALFEVFEQRRAEGHLPAHALATTWYLLRRTLGTFGAQERVSDLQSLLTVTPIDAETVRRALALRWPDFEDALVAASAERAGCDAIVTRDRGGFPNSPVRVLEPAEAIGLLAR